MPKRLVDPTFESARQLANEVAAERGLREFLPPDCTNFLSEFHLEAEGCWYFFPLEGLRIPSERWTLHGFAVAVFKSGEYRIAYDFRDDEQRMQEYLRALSLLALGRDQEARAAMKAYRAKYSITA